MKRRRERLGVSCSQHALETARPDRRCRVPRRCLGRGTALALLLAVDLFGVNATQTGAPDAVAAEFSIIETVEMDGRLVPKGLPDLSLFTLLSAAQPWRPDAKPMRLEVKGLGRRDKGYQVVLNFMSPSDQSGLILLFLPQGMQTLQAGNAFFGNNPYPPRFIDLPDIAQAAHNAGIKGALTHAELKVWERSGPTWRLKFPGPKMVTFSAVTGKQIFGDVTGYIDDYNKRWDEAIAGISSLVKSAISVLSPSASMKDITEGYRRLRCEKAGGWFNNDGVCMQ